MRLFVQLELLNSRLRGCLFNQNLATLPIVITVHDHKHSPNHLVLFSLVIKPLLCHLKKKSDQSTSLLSSGLAVFYTACGSSSIRSHRLPGYYAARVPN